MSRYPNGLIGTAGREWDYVKGKGGVMEIKERWILVFFLLYFLLTFILSSGGWGETFIEREFNLDGPAPVVGMVPK